MSARALTAVGATLLAMGTLAERITEARESAGLSKAELCRAARGRLTHAALSQLESGKSKALKAETALAIAAATGSRVEWLVLGQLPKRKTDEAAESPDDDQIEKDENIRLLVLRELTRALVANMPAAAQDFSALLREGAAERHFRTDTGLIGVVLDTVALGQQSAEAAARRASQLQSGDQPMPNRQGRSHRTKA